jgi:hypothetical protein
LMCPRLIHRAWAFTTKTASQLGALHSHSLAATLEE